jgi:outer membrane protein
MLRKLVLVILLSGGIFAAEPEIAPAAPGPGGNTEKTAAEDAEAVPPAREEQVMEAVEKAGRRISAIVTGGNVLDLESALRRAVQDNPSIQAVGERVAQARQQVRQAWSAWFPQVDTSWSVTRTDIADANIRQAESELDQQAALYERFGLDPDDILDQDIPWRRETWNFNITARFLLFDGLAREFTIAMARFGRQEAEAARGEAWRQLMSGVARSYFGVQLARENIRIAEADESFNQRLLTEAKAARRVGMGSLSDVLNFEVLVRTSRRDLLRSENEYKLARITLATLMGIPGAKLPDDLRVAELSEAQPADMKIPDIDPLIDCALERRPDVRQKQMSVKRNKANTRRQYAAFAPKVALFASRDASRTGDGGFGGDDYNDSVGANVSMDIFTGGRRWWQVAEAKHARRQAEYELTNTELEVMAEVRRAVTGLGTAQEQLILQRATSQYVRKNRDLVKKEYNAGQGSLALLNQAQRNLVQSDAALALARVSLQSSWFDVYTATAETLSLYMAQPDAADKENAK